MKTSDVSSEGGAGLSKVSLEFPALIFFISLDNVARACRSRIVLLAWQVSINDVGGDINTARILEGLQVTAHLVARGSKRQAVRFKLDIAVHSGVMDVSPFTLHDLDAADDLGCGKNPDLSEMISIQALRSMPGWLRALPRPAR